MSTVDDARLRRRFVVLAAAAATWLLSACDYLESSEADYTSYADAAKSGAIGNWVPVWLPTTAARIREFHHVDRPVVWLEYFAPANDAIPAAAKCVAVLPRSDLFPSKRDRPPDWWPQSLLEGGNSKIDDHWTVHRCDGGILAVERDSVGARVLAWITSTSDVPR